MSDSSASDVILIRHAQSQWNLENRFSGWADPPLTSAGEQEAEAAGKLLKQLGCRFDLAYTSRLQRAITTLDLILSTMSHPEIPVYRDWRLNERHYGHLQGTEKTAEAHNTTPEQIWRWRRSYMDKAQALDQQDPRHPRQSELYRDLDPSLLPGVENLAECRVRVEAFWQERVVPDLAANKNLLISAHGNSLRALLMALADMSVEEVEQFEIPTGIPIRLRLDDQGQLQEWFYLEAKG